MGTSFDLAVVVGETFSAILWSISSCWGMFYMDSQKHTVHLLAGTFHSFGSLRRKRRKKTSVHLCACMFVFFLGGREIVYQQPAFFCVVMLQPSFAFALWTSWPVVAPFTLPHLTLSQPKHLYRWWKLLPRLFSQRRLAGQQCLFWNFTPFWSAWQVGIEARGHTMSYRHAGTTLQRTSSDVILAVNGLICHFPVRSSFLSSVYPLLSCRKGRLRKMGPWPLVERFRNS